MRTRPALFALAFLFLWTGAAAAQFSADPDSGGFTKSMGQPPIWKPYLGWDAGVYRPTQDPQVGVLVDVGVFKDLFNPTIGLPGLLGEGYIGARKSGADGGLRALVAVPMLRMGIGADYNFRDASLDFLFRLSAPLRRSGIIGNGSRVRLNWLPWKGQTVTLGLSVPIGQAPLGDTRTRRAHATLPESGDDAAPEPLDDPVLEKAFANIAETAHWVNRLTSPFIDQGGRTPEKALESFDAGVQELEAHFRTRSELFPTGRTSLAEVLAYHAELERAFSIAGSGLSLPVGASTLEGREAAKQARDLLLELVIFPYNRLLGLRKKKDSVLGLGTEAEAAFRAWLDTSGMVAPERRDRVAQVFRRLIHIVEDNREDSRRRWGSERLVWIPLQYGLRPEQHDTQAELNAIVGRAVGKPFAGGNRVWYVDSREFHEEVGAMFRRAEAYSVLWIHDIQGRNEDGHPDAVTFEVVVRGYLQALIEGVRRYDESGTLPVHLVFLDQHRYEDNKARPWMKLLEDPLGHDLRLPSEHVSMSDSIRIAQEDLREAVAASELLQQRAELYGHDWLRNRIKIHVSITNPADPSYWSNQLLPAIKWPDNVMRDHRKLAFYDITEEDPYKGMVIYGGMGIGEHYVGPGWEDRGILLQGPAALSIKAAARELLLRQGFSPEEIPFPLRPRDKPPDYDAIVRNEVESGGAISLALELHNETGHGPKLINVLKATLYTLMPPGSVLIVPDSLWNAPLLASWLVGNCLRGGRVLIVGPARKNAPSNRFAQMSRAQELFARLILLQTELRPEIEAAGGTLMTGLYALDVKPDDVPLRLRAIEAGLASEPLREFVGLQSAITWSERGERYLEANRGSIDEAGESGKRPLLHAKTHFLASREAWQAITDRRDLGPLVDAFIQRLVRQGETPDPLNGHSVTDRAPAHLTVQKAVLEETPHAAQERFIAYLMVGSFNQNYRSMLMDGEVMLTVEGASVMTGLVDYLALLGVTTWIDTLDLLEEHLPAYDGMPFKLARSFKEML